MKAETKTLLIAVLFCIIGNSIRADDTIYLFGVVAGNIQVFLGYFLFQRLFFLVKRIWAR